MRLRKNLTCSRVSPGAGAAPQQPAEAAALAVDKNGYHWTDSYYIASCYFPIIIDTEINKAKRSNMISELITSQTEIYPVQNWLLEIPWEPFSRLQPQYWIKCLDPWVTCTSFIQ